MKPDIVSSSRRFAAGLFAALLLPLSAAASVLLYDGFDYEAGSLAGKNGGEGFKTAWTNSGASTANDVIASGSSYTDAGGNDLFVKGGKLVVSAANSGIYRTLDPITAAANTTTTWWLSFIGSTSGTPAGGAANNAVLSLRDGNTELLSVGAIGGSNAWRVSSNATYSSTNVAASTSEAFVVIRIDIDTTAGGADSIHLWLNPDIGGEAPLASTAASSITGNFWDVFSLNLLRIGASGSFTGIALDELRLGTDFASVAPQAVPEPAVLATLFGGVALLAAFVSRRSGK
ncbi:hypothetical protein OpiT1DRAFT_04810 [Opitutaceae bacterium TAV1]|nr:hypothetical protein OpiT1DRAFT_04810 [Opitutaceae bacterium TAV1]